MSYFKKSDNFLNSHPYVTRDSPKELMRSKQVWKWISIGLFFLIGMTLFAFGMNVHMMVWFGLVMIAYYFIVITLFVLLRDFEKVQFFYLLIVIITTFGFMLKLGGITPSHGLVFIGLGCAMGSVIHFRNVKRIITLFLVYMITILLTGILEPHLPISPDHNPSINILFYIINIFWLTIAVLLMAIYYINQHQHTEKEISRQFSVLRKKKTNDPDKNISIPTDDAFMKRVYSIINDHLSDDEFKIKQLCRELTISRAQLYRKFKVLTDKPVGKFIRFVRLTKAKELIETTNCTVTEAALKTGFKNLSHFSTIFKEEFAISPSELKN